MHDTSLTQANSDEIGRGLPLSGLAQKPPQNSPRDRARVDSQSLFAGQQEVEIAHNGALYRLRQTSLGKLILTK